MQQMAERIEQVERVCHVDREVKVVNSTVKISPTVTGDFDLIEIIIKCDFENIQALITNGESRYRFDVFKTLFQPQREHLAFDLGERFRTDTMFVNGFYARHKTVLYHGTSLESGDNLHSQLVKLFPYCQFFDFIYEMLIELWEDELINSNLLDSRNVGGLIVTNCTQQELNIQRNHSLIFGIDIDTLDEMKQLNMSHCFKGTTCFSYLNETKKLFARSMKSIRT